jgi:D-arabinose 1-dehydrogenase-like Zn-dependent alcohol dehydrogenase
VSDSTRFPAFARVEAFKLEQAEQAFATVLANQVRFRAVLVP